MSWEYHGGLVPTGSKTKFSQSLVSYNGSLWMAYTGTDDVVKYLRTEANTWGNEQPLIVNGHSVNTPDAPTLVVFNGRLYALIKAAGGRNFKLYLFDTINDKWTLPSDVSAFSSKGEAAALAFKGKLYAVAPAEFDNGLRWVAYDGEVWTASQVINGETTWGIAGLYVVDSKLYCAFSANNGSRELLTCVFNEEAQIWIRSASVSENTAYGVCATGGQTLRSLHAKQTTTPDKSW